MVGLWKCDTINLPGFPIARFHNHPPHNRGFIHLVCLIAVHISQLWITWRYCPWLNPVLRSLSVWWISLLMMWDAMSPLSQKYFTLILPVQMHLRRFYLGSLVHPFIVAVFFSSPALGNLHDRLSQSTSLPEQWCLATIQQPRWFSLSSINWSFSINPATLTEHLLLQVTHCTGRVLVILSHSVLSKASWMAF